MIPFTLDSLNRAHAAAPPAALTPLAPPAAPPAPVAAAPAPEPEPARDPTAHLAELLLKSEKARKKKKR